MCVDTAALSTQLSADLSGHIDVQQSSWAPDSSPKQVACYLLRNALLKKFSDGGEPSQDARMAAQKKFLMVNNHVRWWSIPYETSLDEMMVGEFKNALYRFWFTGDGGPSPLISDYHQLFQAGGVGKGSSIAARDSDLYTKLFDSDLSGTEGFPEIWDNCTARTGLFRSAEKARRTYHGYRIVAGNRLGFVNKTVTIARCIATEPTINMWFQKGAGSIMADQLRSHFGLDMSTQPDVNRVLARVGSINGSFATIDLESASDCVGLEMLKECAPKSMFDWLYALRSPTCQLPSGERVNLNMISTQGNGYNSALQTVIFTCVIQSVYRLSGIPFRGRGQATSRTYGCFGDDMIVVAEAYQRVCRLLYLLGFVVNTDKSFVEGQFRESCGADYFDGINVRGVYIKSLNKKQDLFVAINNLNRWTMRTGVAIPLTVSYLIKCLRESEGLDLNGVHRAFVPPDEDDAAGIKVPAVLACDRVARHTRVYGQLVYNPDVPRKWFFVIAGLRCWTFREQVDRNFNPYGLEAAFIAGTVRGYTVSLRQVETTYTTIRRLTPSWDWQPPRPLEFDVLLSFTDDFDRQKGTLDSISRRFVDACGHNLVSCGFGSQG
ncbi:RNA-directed RNA polymerase [ssRNA phage SRR6960551_1]|uniref:RNA-directed RNA polymerase n=1 Tax=ssRNA phage SRR6960551_1 TaxID=2786547 RepID=A0A8S5L4L3_9VIRU|nr:RNA-directed RNA polymerase [ssRNA phage SRR6960551_1]DAD52617.1 TPA_asm: RNA-directed RNA polymerase [ssRNA phage SRR6960551_1]